MFITFKDKPIYFTGEDGNRHQLTSYIIKTKTYMGMDIATQEERTFSEPLDLEWVSFERHSSVIKVFMYSAIEHLILSGFSNYQEDVQPSIRQLIHNALYVRVKELQDHLDIMYNLIPDEIRREHVQADEINLIYMHPDFLSITGSDLIITISKDVNREPLNDLMYADDIKIFEFKPHKDSKHEYGLSLGRGDILYPSY